MTIEEFTIAAIDLRVTDVEVAGYMFKVEKGYAQQIWNVIRVHREQICKVLECMAMEKQLKIWEEYYEEVKSKKMAT